MYLTYSKLPVDLIVATTSKSWTEAFELINKAGTRALKCFQQAEHLCRDKTGQSYKWVIWGLGIAFYSRNNMVDAFKCFSKGAEFGFPLAIHYLGECFLEGYGVQKDVTKALDCFEEAAVLLNFDSFNMALKILFSPEKPVGLEIDPLLERARFLRRVQAIDTVIGLNNLKVVKTKSAKSPINEIRITLQKLLPHTERSIWIRMFSDSSQNMSPETLYQLAMGLIECHLQDSSLGKAVINHLDQVANKFPRNIAQESLQYDTWNTVKEVLNGQLPAATLDLILNQRTRCIALLAIQLGRFLTRDTEFIILQYLVGDTISSADKINIPITTLEFTREQKEQKIKQTREQKEQKRKQDEVRWLSEKEKEKKEKKGITSAGPFSPWEPDPDIARAKKFAEQDKAVAKSVKKGRS
jgi:hypothetical protein